MSTVVKIPKEYEVLYYVRQNLCGMSDENPRPNICKVPHNFTGIDIREITELATA